MREVRARECDGRRDSGQSHHLVVLVRASREQGYTHGCLPTAVRWLDGSDGRLGKCQWGRWHDDARFPRASCL
jgi:hypothetical protein